MELPPTLIKKMLIKSKDIAENTLWCVLERRHTRAFWVATVLARLLGAIIDPYGKEAAFTRYTLYKSLTA